MLRRKVRANAGRQHAISDAARQAVLAQYAAHKSWSVQLHYDNLVALAETKPELKPVPSYPTLRRFMKANAAHPTCQAMIELGRAQKTIFLARYLRSSSFSGRSEVAGQECLCRGTFLAAEHRGYRVARPGGYVHDLAR